MLSMKAHPCPKPYRMDRATASPFPPQNNVSDTMNRFLSVLIALFLVVIGGGMAFLASWDMPTPSHTVEKVIPDERFPR